MRNTKKNQKLNVTHSSYVWIESMEPLLLMSASGTEAADELLDINEGSCIDGLGGDDVLIALIGTARLDGGEGDDTLISARGSNVLNGGDGTDTVVYWENRADFTFEFRADDVLLVSSVERTDELTNVEFLQFDDGLFSVDSLIPNSYRSIDGTGNNLQHDDLGSTNEPLLRLTTAEYGDGVASPAGEGRPSARSVSNELSAQTESAPNAKGMTDMAWLWGQFIDHDVSLTGPADPHEPFNIPVPAGDHLFDPGYTGDAEIEMDRSVYDPTTGDNVDNPRAQINEITAYIDGGMVYGSDEVRAAELRSYEGGKLRLTDENLLIFNDAGLPNAEGGDPHAPLFLAGDVRANENVALTAMHTLWAREHNRLADELAAENSSLNDEELYQQARQIVFAQIQAITYNEFLPTILGDYAIPEYVGYDSTVDPSIAIEFSTAAYRFGHSMLSDELLRLDNDGNVIDAGNLALRDAFFAPDEILDHGIDSILIGVSSQAANEVDTMVVDGVRNFLFGPPGAGGFDLASLNIQRGRDHGIPDYNQLRYEIGLDPVTDFDEITSDVLLQDRLREVYGSVNDVDAWTGGLAEDHHPEASIGKTFHTILTDQFSRLRDGDRFWYENILNGEQLQEIECTTLSDVIERNTTAEGLQDNVFFV